MLSVWQSRHGVLKPHCSSSSNAFEVEYQMSCSRPPFFKTSLTLLNGVFSWSSTLFGSTLDFALESVFYTTK